MVCEWVWSVGGCGQWVGVALHIGTVLISEWIDPTNGSIEPAVTNEISSIAELTAVQLIPPSTRTEGGVASTKGGVASTKGCVAAVDVLKSLRLKRHIILQVMSTAATLTVS